ncbi:MAG: DUF427 domain-containing protein [Gammaproteobacteria bacterium]|nr:DUF427 domain-containing protein [Gammaproteobacteria bacterium]
MTRSDQSKTVSRMRAQWTYRGQERPDFAIEPHDGQESVWDYPRPPIIQEDFREVEVFDGKTLIARSKRTLRVLETAGAPCFYLPPEDVETKRLRQNRTRTFCEWKGEGIGFDTLSGIKDVAWSYPKTFEESKPIEGWIAFYAAKVQCFVNSELVVPQPSGYYGGWVTHEIVGPYKGDPIVDDALKKP